MASRTDTHLFRNLNAPLGAPVASVGARHTTVDVKDLAALVRSGAG